MNKRTYLIVSALLLNYHVFAQDVQNSELGTVKLGVIMLEEVGKWMNINGEAVYGSKAWKTLGEGEIINGKLKKLPGGALGKRHADFNFDAQDIRFTQGKNNDLYAFTMNIPNLGQKIVIHSMGTKEGYLDKKIKNVSLLGYNGKITWKQTKEGLIVTYPNDAELITSAVFRIKI